MVVKDGDAEDSPVTMMKDEGSVRMMKVEGSVRMRTLW